MTKALWAKLGDQLAFPTERDGADPSRSSYERFAIPYSFKPRLSVAEAALSAGGSLLRILLGSLLFGVWGTYTYIAWAAISNVFLRGVFLVVSVAVFATLLVILLLAISTLVRTLWPQRQRL